MDEAHLHAALRYVALNPVRARLVAGQDDQVVKVAPASDRVGDFRAFRGEEFDEAFTFAALRKAETIGRPVGSAQWLEDMAAQTGLALLPKKRGRKVRSNSEMTHLSA